MIPSSDITLLVGAYTARTSKGIYSFRFNSDTGDIQPLASPAAETANPSYVVVSRDHEFVYAVNELHGANQGTVSAFQFEPRSGALTFLNKVSSKGDDPCHLSLSPAADKLFVANYSSGNLSVIPINKDGSLATSVQTLTHSGKGPNLDRQQSAHVHMVEPSPDGLLLFATDLGEDRLYVYEYSSINKERPLQPAAPPYEQLDAGSGPRHFAFSNDGRFVYVIEEMGEAVVVLRRDRARLKVVEKIPVAEKEWPGDAGAAALHLSPDGRFLYASNRADANELVIYSVNTEDGTLKMVARQASLATKPRDFCIDPQGRFLVVAGQESGNLVIFRRDLESGTLTPTGKTVALDSPVCVKMV
ncbi:MAG TPA: lactonase family protein [Terrimicrobiaceae bacterium]